MTTYAPMTDFDDEFFDDGATAEYLIRRLIADARAGGDAAHEDASGQAAGSGSP